MPEVVIARLIRHVRLATARLILSLKTSATFRVVRKLPEIRDLGRFMRCRNTVQFVYDECMVQYH